MDTIPRIRTFHEFRDAVFSFRLPRILLSAIDLDLFTVMGTKPWTVQALAKEVKASKRGISILCRNLASAGLLIKRGEKYQSGNLGKTLLNGESPGYRGAYLNLIRRQWDDWSQLTTSIRTGRPVEDKGEETPEYRRSFTWAMHHRSIEPAKQVAKQLNLRNCSTLLDLGGGPGTYALAFLAKNPKLHAMLVDRPPALDVAKEIAQPLRHGTRLAFHPGDFFKETIPGKYDVIWLSNVIHIYSASENTSLLRKLRSKLNPGGRLLIQDTFLLDPLGLRPIETNLFAVTMLLFTERGNTYRSNEVQQWLHKAGFASPKCLKLKPGTGDWDGIIIQASQS